MKIKKFIPVLMATCAAAAVFSACSTDNAKYDELNARLDADYSQIVLKVTDTFDEDSSLVSEYTMTFIDDGVKISYSVERFSEVSLDSVSAEKTTIVGKAVAVGGNLVYVEGEEVPLDAISIGTGLDFKKEYFANAELTDDGLKADVTDPAAFTGSSITCTEMRVNATFNDVFTEIKITYLAQSGNCVEYLYTFTV